jgi:hypothetical protein
MTGIILGGYDLIWSDFKIPPFDGFNLTLHRLY